MVSALARGMRPANQRSSAVGSADAPSRDRVPGAEVVGDVAADEGAGGQATVRVADNFHRVGFIS